MGDQWRLEPVYVLRNDQGVIVEVSESTPVGYIFENWAEAAAFKYRSASLKPMDECQISQWEKRKWVSDVEK